MSNADNGNPVAKTSNEMVQEAVAAVQRRLRRLNEEEQTRVISVIVELYGPASGRFSATRRDA